MTLCIEGVAREEREKKMRYVLILLGLLVANVASAIDCQKLPSCEELGYSKEDVKGCADNGYLTCPFDENYKKCVEYDCETLGFTNSDKTSWCADLIECKGNEKMTLCQKPCFATDYNSLKELAGSSKCKVVTLRNDIEMPQNQGITIAANTIIDGGSHTLSSSGNQGFNVYTLNNNSGFKNIFIKHNQTQSQVNLRVFNSVNGSKMTLHNTQILVQSNDKENHSTPIFAGPGKYEISGQFTLDTEAIWHLYLSGAPMVFRDADINITTTGASDDIFTNNVEFMNSHGTFTSNYGVPFLRNYIRTLENSEIQFKTGRTCFFIDSVQSDGTTLLKNNSTLTLMCKKGLVGDDDMKMSVLAHIKFESTEDAPATLIVEETERLNYGDVTASNTTDTLILNGVTYRPKQPATTKLSEIESSQNWEKVSQ